MMPSTQNPVKNEAVPPIETAENNMDIFLFEEKKVC